MECWLSNITNMTAGIIDNLTLIEPWIEKRPHNAIYVAPRSMVGYWELMVCLFGTPANILVLYLTAKFLVANFRRSSSGYHQSNLWFVASMTAADTLFCCIHAPMMVAQYIFRVQFNAPSCFFMYIVTHATTICSSLSLLCLNVDKFMYLSRPLHYHRRVTTGRALGVVCLTWAVSMCWAIFFMLGPFSKYNPPCDFRPSQIHFYIVFAVCFFVLPTVVSMSISVYIASVVIRVSKENAIRKSSTRSQTAAVPTTAQRTNAKAIAFVFTTTLWSSLTYLPYRFAYLVYISPVFKAGATWATTTAFYFLFALMATNAAGNPFITIITQRRYTMAAIQFWRWIKTGARGEKLVRRRSSTMVSTMMTFHSVGSKLSMVKKESKTPQHVKLIEDLEATSAL